MSDNRTNEPSEERLLAALNAYQRTDHEQNVIKRPYVYAENLDDWGPQTIARMRAALTAAGVAPQGPDAVEGNAKLLQNSGPSEEQVEAAAKAMWKERALGTTTPDYPWRGLTEEGRERLRVHAREVLRAAWLKDGALTSSHSHSLHVTEDAVRASDDAVTASELEPVILAAEVAWNGNGRREPLARALARDLAKRLQEPS